MTTRAKTVPQHALARDEEDTLRFLADLSCQPDTVIHYKNSYRSIYLLNHPDCVEHVFQSSNFVRTPLLKLVLGDGLLASDGDHWRKQRLRMQPAFRHELFDHYTQLINSEVKRMLDRWQQVAATGESLDVAKEMTRVSLRIIVRALFSTDLDDGEQLINAIRLIVRDLGKTTGTVFCRPAPITASRTTNFRAAVQTLDDFCYRLIRQRRWRKDGLPDLMSLLLDDQEHVGQSQLTDEQLRDEVVTMLIAGHETTSVMLAWAWYLLAQYPTAEDCLHEHLKQELAGELAAWKDVPRLHYTRQVLLESLRIYPPIWCLVRSAVNDDEIGGYRIPAGAMIVISAFTMHRHPRIWPDPERFDPQRFAPELRADLPRYAYFPFGAGRHTCLGEQLAMTEGVLLLAAVAQRFRVRPVEGHAVEPELAITLRQRNGLLATLSERTQRN